MLRCLDHAAAKLLQCHGVAITTEELGLRTTQCEAEDRNSEARFRMCEDTLDREMMVHENSRGSKYMGEDVIRMQLHKQCACLKLSQPCRGRPYRKGKEHDTVYAKVPRLYCACVSLSKSLCSPYSPLYSSTRAEDGIDATDGVQMPRRQNPWLIAFNIKQTHAENAR